VGNRSGNPVSYSSASNRKASH